MEVTLEQVATQLEAISKTLEQQDGLEGRLAAHVDKQLAAAVAELKQQAQANTDDLKAQAQIYKEELRGDVKKAAEGYDATLKKIERELADLNRKVDTGFHDRDLVLRDHIGRIVKLEERR